MKFVHLFLVIVMLFGVVSSIPVHAQGDTDRNPAPGSADTDRNPAPSRTEDVDRNPAPSNGSNALQNPLQVDSLEDLLVAILRIVIVLATPIVVLFIILAGFKYVTARGDAAKTKEATLALTYAVIGGILIIGAVAIAEIIGNLVTAFE